MNAYPGVNSVLLLDNCTIHNADEITHAVHAIGARIEYLEPYDPEHMPIEFGFRSRAKQKLRFDRDLYHVCAPVSPRGHAQLPTRAPCEHGYACVPQGYRFTW